MGPPVGNFVLARPLLSRFSVAQMRTAEQTDLITPPPRSEEVVHLPLGLLGFERFKQFVLTKISEEAPFAWLQAANDPTLTFLVVPPTEVLPGYAPSITDEDALFLNLKSPQDAKLMNIVTLRPNGQATVNLKGPIVLNRFTLIGKQVVLTNSSDYPVQYPLPVAG